MEIQKLETNLETILTSWKFPKNIIEKYKIIGINEIFEWQAECLNVSGIQSKLQIYFIIYLNKLIV